MSTVDASRFAQTACRALTVAFCLVMDPRVMAAPKADPWPFTWAEIQADDARSPDSPRITPPSLMEEVRRAEQLGTQLFDAAKRPADGLSPAQQLVLRTAEAASLRRCPGLAYRAVAIASLNEDASGQLVYLIGEGSHGEAVIARHFRLRVSADGAAITSTTPSALGCTVFPPPAGNRARVANFAEHWLTCTPTEFHTYVSRTVNAPIFIGTSVGTWKVDAGRISFISATARPCAASRLPEVEHHWVAVPSSDPSDRRYSIEFPYFDREAGYARLLGGEARIDDRGDWQWIRREPDDHDVRMQMEGNPFVVLFDAPMLRQLDLPDVPSHVEGYSGESLDPVERRVDRARALNHIGETSAAIPLLEEAYAMDPKASGIGFELAYALNAQGGFARAATIAEIALDRDPTSVLTCKELGYARLRLGRFEDASKTYSLCLDLATKSKGVNDRTSVDRKFMFEILFSLAHAYRGMGQTESCRQSLQDAANWAPAEAPRLPDPAGCAGR